jgi:hypothetical protein
LDWLRWFFLRHRTSGVMPEEPRARQAQQAQQNPDGSARTHKSLSHQDTKCQIIG